MTKPRRGRPKGARNEKTILTELANKRVTLREGKNTRQVTLLEALLHELRRRVMAGEIAAARLVDRLRPRQEMASRSGAGLLLVPGSLTPQEWIRREEVRNLYRQAPQMPDAPLARPLDQPVEQPGPQRARPKFHPGPNMTRRIIR